jgi:integrase
MPKLDRRITDSLVRTLRGPETPAEITTRAVVHWCKDTPGFGVKVSLTGDRSFVSERRVAGKTVRRTLGKAPGGKAAGAISTDTARKLMLTVSSELQTGVDRVEVKREERKVEKQDGITLAVALSEYVKGKRRGKDGLALKDRTKLDYMAMVQAGRTAKDGKPFADGPLYPLVGTPLTKITAAEIREIYKTEEAKSKRVAVYAMQVLRAVLNWHGVAIPDSPLAKSTAGKARIVLSSTNGNPAPIPPERLGAWWRAATALAGNVGADGCRVILLTGCRPGELFGSTTYKAGKTIVLAPGLLVRDVDLKGARMVLLDTKNRSDHTVVLSTQALEIVKANCKGKKPDSKVFDVLDPGKTLEAINLVAGTAGITPHKLRHTFASVAEELVSGYALKRMINHTEAGDVTGNNYVGKSETQLRAAWQTVADFIVSSSQNSPG